MRRSKPLQKPSKRSNAESSIVYPLIPETKQKSQGKSACSQIPLALLVSIPLPPQSTLGHLGGFC